MMKRIFGALVLLLAIGAGMAFYAIGNFRVEQLVLCSEPGTGFAIPAPLCRQYLLRFRMNQNDIDDLQAGGGLAFVLESGAPGKFELAERFIDKGLDVNADVRPGPGDRTQSALHSAVILNQADNVAFLLEHGADKAKPDSEGQTPLQVAERLQSAQPDESRAEVIRLLRE